jgi:hypothetical protein
MEARMASTEGSMKNPTYDLLCFLNTYDDNPIDDKKFGRLMRNLKTHFDRLFGTVEQMLDPDKIRVGMETNPLLGAQLIEYSYLKISTIWDIAYQIADQILSYKKTIPKNADKYDDLRSRFERYNNQSGFLQTEWYRDVNKIRNKVVHGGINVMPFYVDNQLLFEVYDEEVDTIVPRCAIYTVEDGLKNSAAKYFIYYLGILYQYLLDFFNYVLTELQQTVKPERELDPLVRQHFLLVADWSYENLDQYNRSAYADRNLPLTSNRDAYVESRLAVAKFSGKSRGADYRVAMVHSVLQKYGVFGQWDENRHCMLVDPTPLAIDNVKEIHRELAARQLGMCRSTFDTVERKQLLFFN